VRRVRVVVHDEEVDVRLERRDLGQLGQVEVDGPVGGDRAAVDTTIAAGEWFGFNVTANDNAKSVHIVIRE
jgi:hypothetical protein